MVKFLIILVGISCIAQPIHAGFFDTFLSWFYHYSGEDARKIERIPEEKRPFSNPNSVDPVSNIESNFLSHDPDEDSSSEEPIVAQLLEGEVFADPKSRKKFTQKIIKKIHEAEKHFTSPLFLEQLLASSPEHSVESYQNTSAQKHLTLQQEEESAPQALSLSNQEAAQAFLLSQDPENISHESYKKLPIHKMGSNFFHIYKGSFEADVEQIQHALENDGTLIFNHQKAKSLNHGLSGSGRIVKKGTGSLTLLAPCTLKVLEIEEGVVESEGANLPKLIKNNSTLCFQQTTDGFYDGVISGNGQVYLLGGQKLTLKNKQLFLGKTLVCDSQLVLNGEIQDVEIKRNSILSGNGSVHHLYNSGKVTPGNSIGTLVVNGNYVQNANASLEIEFNSFAQSDRVLVTGESQLAGELSLKPQSGVYQKGQTYTFLTTQTRIGEFDSILNTYPDLFSILYFPQSIQIQVNLTAPILPMPLSELVGNDRRMGDYLFANDFTAQDADLANALNTLAALPAPYFREGLIKVSPLIYGSLPRLNLQNDLRVANTFQHRFKDICSCIVERPKLHKKNWFRRRKGKKALKNKHRYLCVKERKQSLWAEPIAFSYQQNAYNGALTNEGQPAFNAYTYGTNASYAHLFNSFWNLNAGLAYTHSNLYWERGLGNANLDTLYLSPSIFYTPCNYQVGFLFQSSFNFYQVTRSIHYGSLKREAKGHHKYFDYLFRIEGSKPFILEKNWTIQPEAQFNYLLIYGEAFDESGADSLDLNVSDCKINYFQPNLQVRLIKEFWLKKGRFYPSIYMGWLANIPLGEKDVQARFVQEQTNRSRVNIVTDQKTTNQMTLGFDLPFQSYRHLTFKGGYEVNFLSLYQIHQVNFRVQWDF